MPEEAQDQQVTPEVADDAAPEVEESTADDGATHAADDDADAQDGPDTVSADYMRKLRKESANYRTKLRDAEKELEALQAAKAELDDLKAAQMSEEEKRQAALEQATSKVSEMESEIQRLQAERQQVVTESALIAAMSKPDAAIVDATAALKLLDTASLEYDDDGNLTSESVAAAIDQLKADYPFMVAAKRASVGDTANPNRSTKDPKLSDDQMRRRINNDTGYNPFDPEFASRFGGGVDWSNVSESSRQSG